MPSKSFSHTMRDKAVLVLVALFVTAVGLGSIALNKKYHIRRAWAFAFWLGVVFVASVGKSLRARFRQPRFVLFFAGWLCVHVLVMLVATSFLIFPLLIPVIFLELCIGYALAFRLFGLPSREESEQAGIEPH